MEHTIELSMTDIEQQFDSMGEFDSDTVFGPMTDIIHDTKVIDMSFQLEQEVVSLIAEEEKMDNEVQEYEPTIELEEWLGQYTD